MATPHKLTCYIIDDEYLAQEILEKYIAKVSFLELLKGSFLIRLRLPNRWNTTNRYSSSGRDDVGVGTVFVFSFK